MFTVLRKIGGNRTPTEHKTVTLGGPDSDVFKDAVALVKSQESIEYLPPNSFRFLEMKLSDFTVGHDKSDEPAKPSLEVAEVSSVETYLIPTDDVKEQLKEQILVARRMGTRPLTDAIGVLSYQAEEIFKDENNDEIKCDGACYEFFYPGDQVYVTNSVGKTVDSIR